jgi:hypothetical protein
MATDWSENLLGFRERWYDEMQKHREVVDAGTGQPLATDAH